MAVPLSLSPKPGPHSSWDLTGTWGPHVQATGPRPFFGHSASAEIVASHSSQPARSGYREVRPHKRATRQTDQGPAWGRGLFGPQLWSPRSLLRVALQMLSKQRLPYFWEQRRNPASKYYSLTWVSSEWTQESHLKGVGRLKEQARAPRQIPPRSCPPGFPGRRLGQSHSPHVWTLPTCDTLQVQRVFPSANSRCVQQTSEEDKVGR